MALNVDPVPLDFSRIPLSARSRKWRANRIWSPEDTPQNTYWQFRRVFSLDSVPEEARLFVTAETRCRVWLNGEPIGRAPKPCQPWMQYYHRFNVAGQLFTCAIGRIHDRIS